MKNGPLYSLLSTGTNFATQTHGASLPRISRSLVHSPDRPKPQKTSKVSEFKCSENVKKKRAIISEKAQELDKILEQSEKCPESLGSQRKILDRIFEVFELITKENGPLQECMLRIADYLKKSVYFNGDSLLEKSQGQLRRIVELNGKTSKPAQFETQPTMVSSSGK